MSKKTFIKLLILAFILVAPTVYAFWQLSDPGVDSVTVWDDSETGNEFVFKDYRLRYKTN